MVHVCDLGLWLKARVCAWHAKVSASVPSTSSSKYQKPWSQVASDVNLSKTLECRWQS